MEKSKITQLLNLGVALLTIGGMYLSSKVHEREMSELQEKIKMDLKNEKEN